MVMPAGGWMPAQRIVAESPHARRAAYGPDLQRKAWCLPPAGMRPTLRILKPENAVVFVPLKHAGKAAPTVF